MAGMSTLTAIRLAILALACACSGSRAEIASTQPSAPPTQSSGKVAGFESAARPTSSASDVRRVEESQTVIVGTVIHVYDGDTIKVRLDSGPIIVRLHSIDTPEHDQPWGLQATSALASRVQSRPVSLRVVTQDSYDRLVADVFLGDESISAWMVQQGDAWAYRHYLEDGIYCTWEGEARAARRGIWSQPPDTWRAPWQWRAAHRGEKVAYADYSHETVANCIAAMPADARPTHASTPPADARR
jgi:micrococcal nuclease